MPNREYDRKLEDALVARLRRGNRPEDLLSELRTRLDEATADVLLSRAEARAAGQHRRQAPPAARILVGFAYAWTAILVLQNIGVLSGSLTLLSSDSEGLLAFLVIFPGLKIALVCAGALAFGIRRSAFTAIFYSGAVLYAFPFGLFIARPSEVGPIDGVATLLSASALLSYVCVLLIGLAWWLTRADAPPTVAAEAFD